MMEASVGKLFPRQESFFNRALKGEINMEDVAAL